MNVTSCGGTGPRIQRHMSLRWLFLELAAVGDSGVAMLSSAGGIVEAAESGRSSTTIVGAEEGVLGDIAHEF